MRLTYIRNVRAKDCGCGHEDRLKEAIIKKYKHLIGTKINGWTILNIIPSNEKNNKTFALCKCQCGTVKDVLLSNIINGLSKNCGCGRKNMLKETRTKSLVGQRFGKLVVLEMIEERNINGRIVYRCKCDCGNEVDVLGNSLTTHHTLSCGCLVSYWNMYIQQFLENNKIKHKSEYPVIIDGNRYRFDFYLDDYNVVIEYDGIQHFEPVDLFGGEENLKKVHQHDTIKNEYCKTNNINLLRIPYWETKNIEKIINNHLQRLSEKGFTDDILVEYATV